VNAHDEKARPFLFAFHKSCIKITYKPLWEAQADIILGEQSLVSYFSLETF